MEVQETKGYLGLKGKIWSLNNKEPKEFGNTKRLLSFGLQTSKENSLFLQVGEWKNTPLSIKVKGSDMTAVETFGEQEGIDKIKEAFKDGDSVFVNLRAEIDTYNKKINFLVNQIYIEKEAIDFDSPTFEEYNELNQFVIVMERPENKEVKVGVATFKGELLEQTLKLDDPDINAYFVENAKVGDLMKLAISVNRKPNYVEGAATTERKTLKGKSVQDGKRVIDKDNPYTEFLEVTDVDLDKDEKAKYTREEINAALDKVGATASKKETPAAKTPTDAHKPSTDIVEEDLPF